MKQTAFRLVQAAFSGVVWAAVGGVASVSVLATGPAAPFIVLGATLLFLTYAKVEKYQNTELEAEVAALQSEILKLLPQIDEGESTPTKPPMTDDLLVKASALTEKMKSAENVMFVADALLAISATASMTTGAIAVDKLAGTVVENSQKAMVGSQLTFDTYSMIDYLHDNLRTIVPHFGGGGGGGGGRADASIVVTEETSLDDLRASNIDKNIMTADKATFTRLEGVYNSNVESNVMLLEDETTLSDGIYAAALDGLFSATRARSSTVTSPPAEEEEEQERVAIGGGDTPDDIGARADAQNAIARTKRNRCVCL